jgi:WD40 repeat protein/transcriptional regulator with XRE-family HTH domain
MAPRPRGDAEPPDPDRAHSQQDFSHELTLARRRAGLTVRQVARASGLPVSTVGDYFAGRHLPPPRTSGPLPKILAVLGIDQPAEVGRWLRVLSRVRRPPGRRPGRGSPPYRGLASFQPGDAAWFFGREELTLHLVRLATGVGATGLPLAVVGPSGSGKSSLLRAGLYPRLAGVGRGGAGAAARPGPRRVLLITPGATPLPTLAAELAPAAGTRDPAAFTADLRQTPQRCAELVGRAGESAPAIIVDQFEEVFTVCEDELERQAFVAALTALSVTTLVVLGLRADYYASALRYPDLARSLQDRQIVVGPMTAGQLRMSITEPARKAGLDLEDGLVELLLRDMQPSPVPAGASAAGHEAGALPLLSHALLVTWERATGNRLTVAGYQAAGGISGAIAQTAEVAYGQLSDAGRDNARQLFLRLVHVAEDARETRARVPLSELPGQAAGPGPGAAAGVPGVLEQFVAHRLVTVDSARAEITHEALLDAWPRLRGWLDADAEDVRIWRFVGPAAQAWASAGRDPAALLRGGQLALARDWAASPAHHQGVSPLAREYVDASVAGDKARLAAQRRQTRRLRRLVAALTVLVLVTIGLAGYGLQQRRLADRATHAAVASRDSAQSRAIAFEADQMRSLDPALAAQLALAAYQDVPTSTALTSLLESSAYPAAARLHDSGGLVQSVAVSPGRHLLAAAGADGTLRLWDIAGTARPVPLSMPMKLGSAHPLYAAAISPNGQIVAAAGAGKTVRLWDVADPSHPRSFGPPLTGPGSTVYALAFSPGGKLLAAGSADKTVRLWDISDPSHPEAVPALAGATAPVQAVAFSPEGTVLAAGSADETVRLWRLTNPAHPKEVGGPLTGPRGVVDAVAFSPDGRMLAAGSQQDHKVWRWDVSDLRRPRPLGALTGATDFVNGVAFSPDGRLLAAASSDDDVRLWNAVTGAPAGTLPHPQPVTSLAWDGPGLLATGDADGQVRLWRVPPPELQAGKTVNSIAAGPGGVLAVGGNDLELWNPAARTELADATIAGQRVVNAVAFSPGGGLVATGYDDGSFQLWRRGTRLAPLGPPEVASRNSAPPNLVEFVAFSPDGRVLATAEDDGTVRLWDVTDPARPGQLATISDAPHNYVYSVAFAPGGHTLAAASTDDLTRLWNITDPAHPAQLATLPGPASYAISVAFSPSGRVLAVGSADKTVWLWDVADPARPHQLGSPLTGPGGYVYSVAFSPGGQTLAAGATDGSVWLWHVAGPAHPKLITSLTGPAGHVYSVAFGPGGRTLAAGSSDGTVWQWDTSPGQAAAGICALAGQPLTRAEWHAYVPGRAYQPPCGMGRG